ncbi:Cna protein B-type domain protein [Candidatus Brocadiaceae bacterium B188]|nr:MAG: hypothetical protein B6D34_00315 [Candidatus Brocadia sp. UTAMX1]RZV58039.1 MAG: carboxypeptidase regulatory-like domain-containing protein [Candidatus Brocadia sp. BROELEC01]TWU52790.1 Cna protein B-type domain protein [Candidatus Brocadiaceae bacterium B188]
MILNNTSMINIVTVINFSREGNNMLKRIFLPVCFAFLFGFLFSDTSVNAQATGIISGVVSKKSGGPIGGAEVILKNKKLQFNDSGVSGNNGEFKFSGLQAGTYTLKVKKAGFKNVSTQVILKEAKIIKGKNKVVNIQMKAQGSGGGSGSGSGSGSGGGSGSAK